MKKLYTFFSTIFLATILFAQTSETTKQNRVFSKFRLALRRKNWDQALTYCSSNIQHTAKISTNSLQNFFLPYMSISTSAIFHKSGTLHIPYTNLNTNPVACLKFIEEQHEWKINLLIGNKKEIPTKQCTNTK